MKKIYSYKKIFNYFSPNIFLVYLINQSLQKNQKFFRLKETKKTLRKILVKKSATSKKNYTWRKHDFIKKT